MIQECLAEDPDEDPGTDNMTALVVRLAGKWNKGTDTSTAKDQKAATDKEAGKSRRGKRKSTGAMLNGGSGSGAAAASRSLRPRKHQ